VRRHSFVDYGRSFEEVKTGEFERSFVFLLSGYAILTIHFVMFTDCSYNEYLSQHGGSSNAYTDAENTNYYFDVNADHLAGALDR